MVALLDPPRSTLRLDRTAENTLIEAVRLDHTLSAHRMPHLHSTDGRLHLNGLSITVHEPLSPGERLSLLVHGGRRPQWQTRGRVISCRPIGDGYRIGIAYDSLPAA